jgi:hypothetical protein
VNAKQRRRDRRWVLGVYARYIRRGEEPPPALMLHCAIAKGFNNKGTGPRLERLPLKIEELAPTLHMTTYTAGNMVLP